MNILFVSSEVAPFAKSGGLADVSFALPKALAKLGHKVKIVMPRYYQIDRSDLTPLKGALGVPMGSLGELWAEVYSKNIAKNLDIYFIDYEAFFGRSGFYSDEHNHAYFDNGARFIFFSRSALQLAKKLEFSPDVLHANDWQSASSVILLKTAYAHEPLFAQSVALFTIHNMEHQGKFDKGIMDILNIGWEHFNLYELEDLGAVNLLKGGIVFADAVTTVSPKYAKEIRTPEFSFGLDSVIAYKHTQEKLFGVLNGVDYDEWSPKVDNYLVKKFDVNRMKGKKECKLDLQKEFGLPQDEEVALIGMVGRFAKQKGIELIAGAMYELLGMRVQIVILGSGEKWAEGFFSDIASQYSDKFACYIGYNNALAHKIEAGCDMFLMPSLFEPCGLNQIYSLRYGTLPIVRAVGGLDDTITNYGKEGANGFKFYDSSAEALKNTVGWALDIYYNRHTEFANMQKFAMKERFDWERVASQYAKIYTLTKLKEECKQCQ